MKMLKSEIFSKFILIGYNLMILMFCTNLIKSDQLSMQTTTSENSIMMMMTLNKSSKNNNMNNTSEQLNIFNSTTMMFVTQYQQQQQQQQIQLLNSNIIDFTSSSSLPSVEASPMKGWRCHCWNSTNEFDVSICR